MTASSDTPSLPANRYFLEFVLRHLNSHIERFECEVDRANLPLSYEATQSAGESPTAIDVLHCVTYQPLPPEVLHFLPENQDGARLSEFLCPISHATHSSPAVPPSRVKQFSAAVLEYLQPLRLLRLQVWTRLQQLDAHPELASDLIPIPEPAPLVTTDEETPTSELANLIHQVSALRGDGGLEVDLVFRTVRRHSFDPTIPFNQAESEWCMFIVCFLAGPKGATKESVERVYWDSSRS